MQAYGEGFAAAYNRRWAFFSVRTAPLLAAFFEGQIQGRGLDRTLLDVCCGSGQLANHFLSSGWEVSGVDLSPHMIRYAQENNRGYVAGGKASFHVDDARSFDLSRTFSFAVSIFDALNHLDSLEDLGRCLARIRAHLAKGGVLVFDLNTEKGLERWNSVDVDEDRECTVISRGIYAPGMERAFTRITGFQARPDGTYDRFTETVYNTVYRMEDVRGAARKAGFEVTCCGSVESLGTPVQDPEALSRAFFVCTAR